MSKRFGRQQKRKFRADAAKQDKTIRRLINTNESLNSSLSGCAQILDDHFVGFDPKTVTCGGHGDYFRIQKMEQLNFSVLDAGSAIDMLPVYIHELGKLESKAQLDEFNNRLHIRVRHPETGKLAYCIDKHSLEQMPKELFIERLSHEFALQLRESL